MASVQTIQRLQTLIWVLIYGGLFAIVFGLILRRSVHGATLPLMLGGIVLVVAGAVLIYVRSRMNEDS